MTLDVTIKKRRKFHDPFFKLSLNPRAKDLNGSNSNPKGLVSSSSGGNSVLGRTVGLSVSPTVPSGSSRLRLRFCELPEGTDSGTMTVFSVETGEGGNCEDWGKVTELTLPFSALSNDSQDYNQQTVYYQGAGDIISLGASRFVLIPFCEIVIAFPLEYHVCTTECALNTTRIKRFGLRIIDNKQFSLSRCNAMARPINE